MIIQGVTITGTSVYDASLVTGNNQLLYLDAGNTNSYPGTGTTWYDISGKNAVQGGTQNAVYNSANGGYFMMTDPCWFWYQPGTFNTTYTGKTVFMSAKLASSMSNGQYRCMFGSNGGNRNFNLYFYYNGSSYQLHYSAGPNGSFAGGISSNMTYTAGNWATFGVTHTTGGLVTYYYNGKPLSTNTGQTFYQYLSTSSENVGASDNYWNGPIGVVGIYGSALSADQMLQEHNAVRARYGL